MTLDARFAPARSGATLPTLGGGVGWRRKGGLRSKRAGISAHRPSAMPKRPRPVAHGDDDKTTEVAGRCDSGHGGGDPGRSSGGRGRGSRLRLAARIVVAAASLWPTSETVTTAFVAPGAPMLRPWNEGGHPHHARRVGAPHADHARGFAQTPRCAAKTGGPAPARPIGLAGSAACCPRRRFRFSSLSLSLPRPRRRRRRPPPAAPSLSLPNCRLPLILRPHPALLRYSLVEQAEASCYSTRRWMTLTPTSVLVAVAAAAARA